MNQVLTVGYEGSSLADFINALMDADIDMLIDVREVPLSRKKGFSKTALSKAVDEAGIDYLHLRALGDPKPGRIAARNGEFQEFRAIYRRHLRTKKAAEALSTVIDLTRYSKICLMCYERDALHCHRKIIADRIEHRTGKAAQHLDVHVKPKIVLRRKISGDAQFAAGAHR